MSKAKVREQRTVPPEYRQWVDECPKCHNRDCLTVFSVTLVETGETYHIESPLYPDGFEFDPGSDYKSASTEDEKVRCDTCGQQFTLDELYLPETPAP